VDSLADVWGFLFLSDEHFSSSSRIKEVQEAEGGKATLKYAVLPLGAIAGSSIADWAMAAAVAAGLLWNTTGPRDELA